jgi:hypothetical protein
MEVNGSRRGVGVDASVLWWNCVMPRQTGPAPHGRSVTVPVKGGVGLGAVGEVLGDWDVSDVTARVCCESWVSGSGCAIASQGGSNGMPGSSGGERALDWVIACREEVNVPGVTGTVTG